MKSILLVLAGALVMISLGSCKKDYVCSCHETTTYLVTGGVLNDFTSNLVMNNTFEQNAVEACAQVETEGNYTSPDGNYVNTADCTLSN
jgi:hypothetical protein